MPRKQKRRSNQTEETAEHDISRLLEECGVGVDPPVPPSAMPVEFTSLDLAPAQQLTPQLQPQLVDLEAPSPEICFLQPFPLEASGSDSLLSISVQSPTLDTDDLQQIATPVPSFMQADSPSHHSVAACLPHTSTHESTLFSAALASVEDEPSSSLVQHQEEAAPGPFLGDTAVVPKKRSSRRRSRPRKPKLYEMGPLEDKEAEERRKKAVIAKLHRDKQKEEVACLAREVEAITAERDSLMQQAEHLMQSEAQLRLRLARYSTSLEEDDDEEEEKQEEEEEEE